MPDSSMQVHVVDGVGAEQHDVGRLLEFLAVEHVGVGDAGDALAVRILEHLGDPRMRAQLEVRIAHRDRDHGDDAGCPSRWPRSRSAGRSRSTGTRRISSRPDWCRRATHSRSAAGTGGSRCSCAASVNISLDRIGVSGGSGYSRCARRLERIAAGYDLALEVAGLAGDRRRCIRTCRNTARARRR